VKFDIYGRFQVEVRRENGAWVIYRIAPGKRYRETDFVIPDDLPPEQIQTYLDAFYHELAGYGQNIVALPP
jgi:hypothetical protein